MILVNDLAASGPNSRHHRTFGAILLECERYRRKSKVLLSIQFGCSLFEFVSKIRTQGTLMAMLYTMGRMCDWVIAPLQIIPTQQKILTPYVIWTSRKGLMLYARLQLFLTVQCVPLDVTVLPTNTVTWSFSAPLSHLWANLNQYYAKIFDSAWQSLLCKQQHWACQWAKPLYCPGSNVLGCVLLNPCFFVSNKHLILQLHGISICHNI